MRSSSGWLAAGAVILGLVVVAAGLGARGAGALDATVQVGSLSNRFTPSTVQIEPGDSVTFDYMAGTHNVTFRPGFSFDEDLSSGEVTAGPFVAVGEYYYYCRFHGNSNVGPGNFNPSTSMVGLVIVGDPPPATATTTHTPTSSPSPTTTTAPQSTTTPTQTPTTGPTATPTNPGSTPGFRVIGPSVAKN